MIAELSMKLHAVLRLEFRSEVPLLPTDVGKIKKWTEKNISLFI